MKDLSRRLNIALIIITHNLGVVARYADRVNVMYAARIIEQGSADDIFLRPCHPYTIGLMRSVPRLDQPRGQSLETIEGLPPDLRAPPAGCRFAPRCPFRIEVCEQDPDAARGRCRPSFRLLARRRDRGRHAQAGAAAAQARGGRGRQRDTAAPLLEVEGLHKYFSVKAAGAGFLSSKTATVKAVDDVSFTIAAGETLGLVGESGCGKTTDRPHHPQARGGDQRRNQLRRRRHHPPLGAGRCARCAARSRRSSRTPIRRSIRA